MSVQAPFAIKLAPAVQPPLTETAEASVWAAPTDEEVQWALAVEPKPASILEDAIPIETESREYAAQMLGLPLGLVSVAQQTQPAYPTSVALDEEDASDPWPQAEEYSDSQIRAAYGGPTSGYYEV